MILDFIYLWTNSFKIHTIYRKGTKLSLYDNFFSNLGLRFAELLLRTDSQKVPKKKKCVTNYCDIQIPQMFGSCIFKIEEDRYSLLPFILLLLLLLLCVKCTNESEKSLKILFSVIIIFRCQACSSGVFKGRLLQEFPA